MSGQVLRLCLLTVLVCGFHCASAFAQTSAFTYQGRLTDNGTQATGTYDIEFRLFDALTDGNQLPQPTPITLAQNVSVTNGVFTVQLDFGGATAFNGSLRWLQISVKKPTDSSFVLLTPRQPVNSTPYAIRSLNATSADTATNSSQLGGVAASQYVITTDSRMSDARTPAAGSGNYIQNGTSTQTPGDFNISGSGFAGGALTGVVVNAVTQFSLGNQPILRNPGSSNIYLGIDAGPTGAVFGAGNSFFGSGAGQGAVGSLNSFFGLNAGANNSSGSNNSFFGASAGNNSQGRNNSFFGLSTGVNDQSGQNNSLFGVGADFSDVNSTGNNNTLLGTNAQATRNLNNQTAIGAQATVTQSNSLVLGAINGVNLALADTNVGIGTTAPASRLHLAVSGSGSPISAMAIDVQSFQTPGNAVASYFFKVTDIGSGSPPTFLIRGDGHVGLGTAAPDNTLTVNGTADKPGGGSWGTFSDERLKNIKGRFTPGLKAVMQLQPVRYEYKRDNALGIKAPGEQVGFGAQSVQRIIPEAVTQNDKGYLLVNNDPIIWTMLNAIKEQQAEIEQQRKLIERQQQQMNRLGKLFCLLKPSAEICKDKE